MEDNAILVVNIKEEIKKIKLEIIEKLNKIDELLESIDNSNEEEIIGGN